MKRGLSYHINLVKELVIADLKLKYRGSVLGYCWTVISPLLMFAVYYIVFSFIKMRASSFALYLLSGLLIWQFFSDGVRSGMNSVTNKSELITKMNFPKIVIPLTSVITSTVILTLNIIVFFIFYIIIKGTFSWTILLLPLYLIPLILLTLGAGYLLSSAYLRFKDLSHVIHLAMKVGFWMTPVVYPLKMIPEQYQFIMFANPVARSLFDIRDVLIYDTIPQWTFTALTVIISIAIFVLGIYVFTKRMHKFAEEV